MFCYIRYFGEAKVHKNNQGSFVHYLHVFYKFVWSSRVRCKNHLTFWFKVREVQPFAHAAAACFFLFRKIARQIFFATSEVIGFVVNLFAMQIRDRTKWHNNYSFIARDQANANLQYIIWQQSNSLIPFTYVYYIELCAELVKNTISSKYFEQKYFFAKWA